MKKSACILCIFCIHWCSNRTVLCLAPPTLYSCKSNRKVLLGGLLVLSVRPFDLSLPELFTSPTQLLSTSISISLSLFHCRPPVILNAEVFWQVGWIPISCDYQEVDKKSWGQWMTLYFHIFLSHLIHNYQQILECYPLSIFSNWVIFLNSISSADVSLWSRWLLKNQASIVNE